MPNVEPIINVLRRAHPLRFNAEIRPLYDRLVGALLGAYTNVPDVLDALNRFLMNPRGDATALVAAINASQIRYGSDVVRAMQRLSAALDDVSHPKKKRSTANEETPDFDAMSPDELMAWMEDLAQQQGAFEGFVTEHRMDLDPLDDAVQEYSDAYIPYMDDDEWVRQQAEEEVQKATDPDSTEDDDTGTDAADDMLFFDDAEVAEPPQSAPPPAPPKPAAPPMQEVTAPEPQQEEFELDWLADMAADVDTESLGAFGAEAPDRAVTGLEPLADDDAVGSAPPGEDTDIDERAPMPEVRVVDEAHFSAYYPPEVAPGPVYGLYVYVHTPEALRHIRQDVTRFQQRLGGSVPEPASARKSALLAHGAVLTVVPQAAGVTFDPPMQTRTWRGDWSRFDFDFTLSEATAEDMLAVRASVQVAGIEIAHIMCPIMTASQGESTRSINPLLDAKLKSSSAQMYTNIFISYAREDTEVAESYRLAQQAAGHEVFMDSYSIRAGENWQAALANAIDESDIFQLFWSRSSADSENVRDEWEYALEQRCAGDDCAGFIRPVYWQQPLVEPPPELGHLNFTYVPLIAAEEDQTFPIATSQQADPDLYAEIAAITEEIAAMRHDLRDIKDAIRLLYTLMQETNKRGS